MKELESIAKGKNYQQMFLTVAAANKQAIAFYERLGLRKVPSGPDWGGRMEKELLAHPLHAPAVKCQAP
jgi:RimJ/RimL family protein N-acetyltransferase